MISFSKKKNDSPIRISTYNHNNDEMASRKQFSARVAPITNCKIYFPPIRHKNKHEHIRACNNLQFKNKSNWLGKSLDICPSLNLSQKKTRKNAVSTNSTSRSAKIVKYRLGKHLSQSAPLWSHPPSPAWHRPTALKEWSSWSLFPCRAATVCITRAVAKLCSIWRSRAGSAGSGGPTGVAQGCSDEEADPCCRTHLILMLLEMGSRGAREGVSWWPSQPTGCPPSLCWCCSWLLHTCWWHGRGAGGIEYAGVTEKDGGDFVRREWENQEIRETYRNKEEQSTYTDSSW
jgi:hypothetical protein